MNNDVIEPFTFSGICMVLCTIIIDADSENELSLR